MQARAVDFFYALSFQIELRILKIGKFVEDIFFFAYNQIE